MIGIIFIGDLRYCPYLDKYVDIIEEANKKYEVLYWNRSLDNTDSLKKEFIPFNYKSELRKNPFLKIWDFYKFRKWLIREMNNKNYDKLIVLTTLSGVILNTFLYKRYRRKYIYDIRDFSYENIGFFRKIEEKLIRESDFTSISSKGFYNFLPIGYDYVVCHNISDLDIWKKVNEFDINHTKPIRIVWIGVIRYYDHQIKIINKLKNDRSFQLIYHGNGPDLDKLKEYCKSNEIKNVMFTGAYLNQDKQKLLAEADILNNSYNLDNSKDKVKYAMSNKYYDGLIYKLPQLVEHDTYKAEQINKAKVGIALDVNDIDLKKKVIDYYYSINKNEFIKCCNDELSKILEEDKIYKERISKFINS